MAEFIDIDEAKAYVGFRAGVDDAAKMDTAHLAGNELVLTYLDWDPTRHTATEEVNGLGGPSVQLSRKPIIEVLSVAILDGPQVPVASLTWSERMLTYRRGSFPRGTRNVTVRYTAGYTVLPEAILEATRIAIKAVWTSRSMEHNFTSHQIAGVESATFHATGPGTLPPAAQVLLNPHRLLMRA